MKQKRIFLLIGFFLVAGFIFGIIIFNKSKLSLSKNNGDFFNNPAIKKDIDKIKLKDNPNMACGENWEKYANDALGIGFCYPKAWGKAYVDPIKDLTLLDGAVDEYSKDENNVYSNALFVKFENNQRENSDNKIELRIFNNYYKGEHYPNSQAYDKGYLDNIDKLKASGDICDYKINFTEMWQEQGRMTELWGECENGIKTSIVKHEQYFDKALYSYNLESMAYLNLQNNFFDNVLVKKSYLHISQIEKKINNFEEIFEAKNYPSNVDNSRIISKGEFEKQREEFIKFANSIYSYSPIVPGKKDFEKIDGEDAKITVIRKYYWLLESHNLEEAYRMQNKTNASLDDFSSAYKKTRMANARDFEKINDNTFKFFVDYQEHNKPRTVYRITMRVLNNEKIEPIITEEIVSEMAEYGGYKAYAKKQNGKSFVILEKYGIEIIVDEGVADYNADYSNMGEVKFFRDIKFSKNGNYLFYNMYGWEWMGAYIYDIGEAKEVFKSDSPHTFSFDKDEKSLFVCTSAGIGTGASGAIYSLPDFKKQFVLFNPEKSSTLEVYCGYDENKNELTFIYDKDCDMGDVEKNDKCNKYEVIYSFDENKMISTKIFNK